MEEEWPQDGPEGTQFDFLFMCKLHKCYNAFCSRDTPPVFDHKCSAT